MRSGTAATVVSIGILFEGALALLAWGLGAWLGVRPFAALTPSVRGIMWGVAATLPLLLGLAWTTSARRGPLARLVEEVDSKILPLFTGATVLDLAMLSLMAGVAEEALFRGVIQAAVTRAAGPWLGLALASVLFGLAHLVTPTYAVLAALVGAYLGGLFLWTDDLIVPVVAHGLYDFLALSYLVRMRRPPPPTGWPDDHAT